MTREEAIKIIEVVFKDKETYKYYDSVTHQALNMAIEALQAEPTKAVPPSLAEVYKWERDIALSQLEEYGIGFAEKKRDDLVEVVRCKDCKWYKKIVEKSKSGLCHYDLVARCLHDDDYCSHGERREE